MIAAPSPRVKTALRLLQDEIEFYREIKAAKISGGQLYKSVRAFHLSYSASKLKTRALWRLCDVKTPAKLSLCEPDSPWRYNRKRNQPQDDALLF